MKKTIRDRLKEHEWLAFDLLVLIAVTTSIIFTIDMKDLFAVNTPDGGDYLFHYMKAKFWHENMPPLRVMGWGDINNAGFAMYLYYPPFVFMLINLLSYIWPLPVVFKLVSYSGIILLPCVVYVCMRRLRPNDVSPAYAVALLVPFLFQIDNFAFGGNIKSVFVGEFCYSIDLLLLVVYCITFFTGVRQGRHLVVNSILLFLICITHPVPWAVAVFIPLWALSQEGLGRNMLYIVKMYLISVPLALSWLLPYATKIGYSGLFNIVRNETGYEYGWPIDSITMLFPGMLIPIIIAFVIICIILTAGFAIRRTGGRWIKPDESFMIYCAALPCIFFYFKPIGWAIRFLPLMYLFAILAVALVLGRAVENKSTNYFAELLHRNRRHIAVYVLIISFFAVYDGNIISTLHNISFGALKGHEKLNDWDDIKNLTEFLNESNTKSRVLALSLKPETVFMLTGRGTVNGMFTYSMASLHGNVIRDEFTNAGNTTRITDDSLKRLEWFNACWIIASKASQVDELRNTSGIVQINKFGSHNLFYLSDCSEEYVIPLRQKPELVSSLGLWKNSSLEWFKKHPFEPVPAYDFVNDSITESVKYEKVNATEDKSLSVYPDNCSVESRLFNGLVKINTTCIGRPLLVEVSYHPNWKVMGADRIYIAGPAFMLIYPSSENVTLYYGRTAVDYAAIALLIIGLILASLFLAAPKETLEKIDDCLLKKIAFLDRLECARDFIARAWPILLVSVIVLLACIANVYCRLDITMHDARSYSQAVKMADDGEFSNAIVKFRGINSKAYEMDKLYYLALLNLKQGNFEDGKRNTFSFISRNGNAERAAELRYYYTLAVLQENDTLAFLHEVHMINASHPGTIWNQKIQDFFKNWSMSNEYEPEDLR